MCIQPVCQDKSLFKSTYCDLILLIISCFSQYYKIKWAKNRSIYFRSWRQGDVRTISFQIVQREKRRRGLSLCNCWGKHGCTIWPPPWKVPAYYVEYISGSSNFCTVFLYLKIPFLNLSKNSICSWNCTHLINIINYIALSNVSKSGASRINTWLYLAYWG